MKTPKKAVVQIKALHRIKLLRVPSTNAVAIWALHSCSIYDKLLPNITRTHGLNNDCLLLVELVLPSSEMLGLFHFDDGQTSN